MCDLIIMKWQTLDRSRFECSLLETQRHAPNNKRSAADALSQTLLFDKNRRKTLNETQNENFDGDLKPQQTKHCTLTSWPGVLILSAVMYMRFGCLGLIIYVEDRIEVHCLIGGGLRQATPCCMRTEWICTCWRLLMHLRCPLNECRA